LILRKRVKADADIPSEFEQKAKLVLRSKQVLE
jgi:hypothetical protein